MQDLIVGERYYIKHRDGIWKGQVTYLGITDFGSIKVKDVNVLGFDPSYKIKEMWEFLEYKGVLGGTPEWWGFELVDISLENE